jgi:hypothetical protein
MALKRLSSFIALLYVSQLASAGLGQQTQPPSSAPQQSIQPRRVPLPRSDGPAVQRSASQEGVEPAPSPQPGPPPQAQPAPRVPPERRLLPPPTAAGGGDLVSLNFSRADLVEVIHILAQHLRLTYTIDPDARAL